MTLFASPAAFGFLSILIGPCTLLAFLWMNRYQPQVSATTAGVVYCMEPVFASVFALVLPVVFSQWAGVSYGNESITQPLVVGGGLILVANVLMQWPSKEKGQSSLLNEHGV